MNKTQFTSGPWRLLMKKTTTSFFCRILAKDGSGNRELIVIGDQDEHPIKEHIERRVADMKLISHAPEMYELLEQIIRWPGNSVPKESIKELLDRITPPVSEGSNGGAAQ